MTALSIIAGAPRSGKSRIARRLLAEKQVPYFSTDYLVTAFDRGVPEIGIRHGIPSIERSEKLWPKLKPVAVELIYREPVYLLEGVDMLPRHIRELVDSDPQSVRACFIGYTRVAPQEKLRSIRDFDAKRQTWTKGVADEFLLELIERMIELSQYLKTECARFRLPYFDTSADFMKAGNEAYRYLAAAD